MARYLSFVKAELEIFMRKPCCVVPCNSCWASTRPRSMNSKKVVVHGGGH